jgi:hypothetical protein
MGQESNLTLYMMGAKPPLFHYNPRARALAHVRVATWAFNKGRSPVGAPVGGVILLALNLDFCRRHLGLTIFRGHNIAWAGRINFGANTLRRSILYKKYKARPIYNKIVIGAKPLQLHCNPRTRALAHVRVATWAFNLWGEAT